MTRAEFNKQLNILNDNTIFQDRLSLADRGALNFRQRVEGGRDNDLLSGPDDLQSLRDSTKAGRDSDATKSRVVANLERELRLSKSLIGLNREEQAVLREKAGIEERIAQFAANGYSEERLTQIRTIIEETYRFNRANEESLRVAEEMRAVWDDAFGGFFDNLLRGKLEFSNFIDHLGGELLRLQLQKNLVDPLSNALSNFAGSLFSGGGDLYGPAETGGGPAAPARALGGPVSRGNPYMVGERGPELFVPGSNGRIIANNKMGGGNVMNVTVNNAVEEASVNVYQDDQGQTILDIVRDDMSGGKTGRAMNVRTGTARQGV